MRLCERFAFEKNVYTGAKNAYFHKKRDCDTVLMKKKACLPDEDSSHVLRKGMETGDEKDILDPYVHQPYVHQLDGSGAGSVGY